MAEEQQGGAQNKLGQLYVELGAKGLGGLTKGLNGLSAQFLLTKNAAQQAIKPLADMSMKAANSVTGWDKLHAVMGLSLQEIQDISRFTKLNNVDFSSFMGQLKGVQKMLFDIKAGMGSEGLQGLAILGLDTYNFDPRKPLAFLDVVKKRVMEVDEVQAAAALRYLGLNEELLYVWKQQNNNFDERLNLSDKEMNNLKEQQSAWNSLKVTWEAAQQKFISNQNWINKLLNEASNIISDIFIKGEEPKSYLFKKQYDDIAKNNYRVLQRKIDKGKTLTNNEQANYQLAKAYLEGNKDVYAKYDLQHSNNNVFFKEEEQKHKIEKPIKIGEEVNRLTPEQFKKYNQLKNENPILNPQANHLQKITGAIPLNEETKNVGLPPLPQVEPSKPTQFLPSSEIKGLNTQQYTVIQDIKQYIQGNEAQQIANETSIKLTSELNSAFLQNLGNK